MAQQTNIRKEYKKDLSKEKNDTPFIQVDKHGDPLSNFMFNLKRQFKKAKGLKFGRLFFGNPSKQPPSNSPINIIGATKTVLRTDYAILKDEKSLLPNKRSGLKNARSIKVKQNNPAKTNKPKLRL